MGRLTTTFALFAGLAASEGVAAAEEQSQIPKPATTIVRVPTGKSSGPPVFRTATVEETGAASSGAGPDTVGSKFAAAGERDPAPQATVVPQTTAPPVGVDAGAPNWVSFENPGEPLDYFRYWGTNAATTPAQAADPAFNNEITSSTSDPHRPQVTFDWQPSVPIANQTAFAHCAIADQPDNKIFWLSPPDVVHPGGFDLGADPVNNPQYRSVLPSEFTIGMPASGVNGFKIDAALEGNAPGSPANAFAINFMYMTDRRCSDGNNEYGFTQELASTDPKFTAQEQPLNFYYSARTNCYAAWGCRDTPSWSAGTTQEILGGDPADNGTPLTITNVQHVPVERPLRPHGDEAAAEDAVSLSGRSSPSFIYSAYMVPDDVAADPEHNTGYKFRVQVIDGDQPGKLANCSVDGGPQQPCTTDVRIQSFFPAQQVMSSSLFLNVGTQTSISGDGVNRQPTFDGPAKFTVNSIKLGR